MKSHKIAPESNAGISVDINVAEIVLDKAPYISQFQKPDTMSIQVSQTITRHSIYPERKVATSLEDSLIPVEQFGFTGQEFDSSEKRVAFPLVPVGFTEAQALAAIAAANANGGCIYKILSDAPILDENQRFSITAGQKTMNDYANSQAARVPDNERTKANGTAGKLVTKDGKVTYRQVFYSSKEREDQDLRGKVEAYISPELKMELDSYKVGAAALEGQVTTGNRIV